MNNKIVKMALCLMVLSALVMPSIGAPKPAGIGWDQEGAYDKWLEDAYKLVAADQPDIGFLEVQANILFDDMFILVTIENVNEHNIGVAAGMAAAVYAEFYKRSGWPDKASIYVDKPDGTQVAAGTLYSKWVEDYFLKGDVKTYAQKGYSALKIWTWQLDKP